MKDKYYRHAAWENISDGRIEQALAAVRRYNMRKTITEIQEMIDEQLTSTEIVKEALDHYLTFLQENQ